MMMVEGQEKTGPTINMYATSNFWPMSHLTLLGAKQVIWTTSESKGRDVSHSGKAMLYGKAHR